MRHTPPARSTWIVASALAAACTLGEPAPDASGAASRLSATCTPRDAGSVWSFALHAPSHDLTEVTADLTGPEGVGLGSYTLFRESAGSWSAEWQEPGRGCESVRHVVFQGWTDEQAVSLGTTTPRRATD
ncbi:MAG: hypothetical protein H6733_16145 [Alphaproteobacteria bacterium]|nr:hypothetical protein [Alphaproteobacteria bacterium]